MARLTRRELLVAGAAAAGYAAAAGPVSAAALRTSGEGLEEGMVEIPAAGTVLSLDVPVTATCEACSGTGGALFDCEHCGGEGRAIRRLPVPVHVPAGVREGSVFQVRTDQPAVPSILLTVHLRRI